MILVTEDDENLDACKENGIQAIKFGQGNSFEDLLLDLKKFPLLPEN
jgi:hypothetical protein